MPSILIIDDEADIRYILSDILQDEGYQVDLAHNSTTALEKIHHNTRPRAVILDIWLEGSSSDGIGLLKVIKKKYPLVPVIMISGHGNIKTAVQTIKLGAYDFIEKPFKSEKLLILLRRALETSQLSIARQNVGNDPIIIGKSKAVADLRDNIDYAAKRNNITFIIGEQGVGKEHAAWIINHKLNKNSFNKFKVRATGVENHKNSLFGGEAQGVFEQSYNSLIYIENIDNLSTKWQEELFSRYQQFATNAKIKIICSILDKTKAQSTLIDELQKFLHTGIEIRPLRERKKDISLLIQHFTKDLSGDDINCSINDDALAILLNYDWPGNVGQLRDMVEWLKIYIKNNKLHITVDILPKEIVNLVYREHDLSPMTAKLIAMPLKEARESFEKEYLQIQLSRFSHNIAQTANFIGMDRTALHRKLKTLKLAK